MLVDFKLGQASIVLRVKIRNSSVSTGAGLTGLLYSSTGLIISTIADNEATPTVYTVAGSTIEDITTLGTFATPTATKCRFKEVDSTNHKGICEIQIANARYAVSNAKSLLISISGATNAAECDVVVPLRTVDPYSASYGLTALTGVTAPTAGAFPTIGTGSGQINPASGKMPATLASTDVTGNVACDLQTIKTQAVTAAAGVTFPASIGTSTYAGGAVASVTAQVTANVAQWGGANIATPAVSGVPKVDIAYALGAAVAMFNGTATAGGASTITLAAGDSATNDIYKGRQITIVGGTGVGQARMITGYVGSSKVATVHRAWDTQPSTDSQYSIDALLEIDTRLWNGTAVATPATAGYPAVTVKVGTGTGELATTSGAVIAGTVGDKTGYTVSTVSDKTGYSLTALPAIATDWLTAAGVKADAVTKIQAGLATPTNITAGTITTATSVTNAVLISSGTGSGQINLSNGRVPITGPIPKNTALNGFEFQMVLSSDKSPATGKTVTATRSIDGAGASACANAPAEIGSGAYKINLANTDLNGGKITFYFSETDCDTVIWDVLTTP